MTLADPGSSNWLGTWKFTQQIDYGYLSQYGGQVIEEINGVWTFLPNQGLLQDASTVNTYLIDSTSGASTLINQNVSEPFAALWGTDYNQFRPNVGYYNLITATSLIGGSGLSIDPETGQGAYDFTNGGDISWTVGPYYEFTTPDIVTTKYDVDDPYEVPVLFERLGGPGNWHKGVFGTETTFQVDINDDGHIGVPLEKKNNSGSDVGEAGSSSYDDVLIGTEKNDKLKASGVATAIYGYEGNDKLIGSRRGDLLDGGRGNDKLKGRSGADIYILSGGDDTFYGFKPKKGDRILISAATNYTIEARDKHCLIKHDGGTTTVKKVDINDIFAAVAPEVTVLA